MELDTLFYFIRAIGIFVFIYYLKKPMYIKILLLFTSICLILADLTHSMILSYLTLFLLILCAFSLIANFIIDKKAKKM